MKERHREKASQRIKMTDLLEEEINEENSNDNNRNDNNNDNNNTNDNNNNDDNNNASAPESPDIVNEVTENDAIEVPWPRRISSKSMLIGAENPAFQGDVV